jgi:hypothetical protein
MLDNNQAVRHTVLVSRMTLEATMEERIGGYLMFWSIVFVSVFAIVKVGLIVVSFVWNLV